MGSLGTTPMGSQLPGVRLISCGSPALAPSGPALTRAGADAVEAEPTDVALVFRWWIDPSARPQIGGHRIDAGQRVFFWSGRRDSNPRPPPWQGGALPTEPRPHAPRGHSESRHWDSGLQRPPLRRRSGARRPEPALAAAGRQ